MQTTSTAFKNMVADALKQLNTDSLGLRNIEAGDGDLVAKAIVGGVPTGSMLPMALVLRRHHDHMVVEARMVSHVGSAGSLMNCTAVEYLRTLLNPEDDGPERLSDRMGILRLFLHTYMASSHTTEEFLANLIEASNASHVFTRAIRDPRDGEVYLTAAMECDYSQMPRGFTMIVEAVLDHARKIAGIARLIQDLIMPEAPRDQTVLAQAMAAQAVGLRMNGDKTRSAKTSKPRDGLTL